MPAKRSAADAACPPPPPRTLPPRWVTASSDSLSDGSPTTAVERAHAALPAPFVYNVQVAGQTYQVRAVSKQDGAAGVRPELRSSHGSSDNLAADTHDTPPPRPRVPRRATPSPTVTPLNAVLSSSGSSGGGAANSSLPTPPQRRPGREPGDLGAAGASLNTPPLGPTPAAMPHLRYSNSREGGSGLNRGGRRRSAETDSDGAAAAARSGSFLEEARRGSLASVATNASSNASTSAVGAGAIRITLTPPIGAAAAVADSPMSAKSSAAATFANSPLTGPRPPPTSAVAALTSTMRHRSGTHRHGSGGLLHRGNSTSLSVDSCPSLESNAASMGAGPPSASSPRRRRGRGDERLTAAAREGGHGSTPRSPSARRVHFILDTDDAAGALVAQPPAWEPALLPTRSLEEARATPFSPHRPPPPCAAEAEVRTISSAASSGANFAMSSSGELGSGVAPATVPAAAAAHASSTRPTLARTSPPLAPMSPLSAPPSATASTPTLHTARKEARAEPAPGVLRVTPSGQLVLSASTANPGSHRSGSADSYTGALYQPEQPLPKPALKLVSRYSGATTTAAGTPAGDRGGGSSLNPSTLTQLRRRLAEYVQDALTPAPVPAPALQQQQQQQAQRRTRTSAGSPSRASVRGGAADKGPDGLGAAAAGAAGTAAAAAPFTFSCASAGRRGGRQRGAQVFVKWSLLGFAALVSLFLILVATATD